MTTLTKKHILPLALLLFSLALAACTGAYSPQELSVQPQPGEAPPADSSLADSLLAETPPVETAHPFTLPSAPDGEVSLETYAGKRNVVLVFYRGFW